VFIRGKTRKPRMGEKRVKKKNATEKKQKRRGGLKKKRHCILKWFKKKRNLRMEGKRGETGDKICGLISKKWRGSLQWGGGA